MDKNKLVVASRVLELFCALNELPVSEDWDVNDPECYQEYQDHCIVTIEADIEGYLNENMLMKKFAEYLDRFNQDRSHPYHFDPYCVDVIDWGSPERSHIYLACCYI